MNTKAEMNFQLILFILAGIFLVSAAFAFIPSALESAKEIFEGTFFDFTADSLPEQLIDEERIDAGKEIPIDKVESDSKSGYLVIVKQDYGEGWNLESAFYKTFTEDIDCPWYWSDEQCEEARKSNAPLIPNQKIEEILASEKTRGKIEIDGKNYLHIGGSHGNYKKNIKETTEETTAFYWFKDINNNQEYEGEDFADSNNSGCWDQGEPLTDTNNNQEYDGECITVEDLTKVILASLYTEATGE